MVTSVEEGTEMEGMGGGGGEGGWWMAWKECRSIHENTLLEREGRGRVGGGGVKEENG